MITLLRMYTHSCIKKKNILVQYILLTPKSPTHASVNDPFHLKAKTYLFKINPQNV